MESRCVLRMLLLWKFKRCGVSQKEDATKTAAPRRIATSQATCPQLLEVRLACDWLSRCSSSSLEFKGRNIHDQRIFLTTRQPVLHFQVLNHIGLNEGLNQQHPPQRPGQSMLDIKCRILTVYPIA
jgi:hypothetical protein